MLLIFLNHWPTTYVIIEARLGALYVISFIYQPRSGNGTLTRGGLNPERQIKIFSSLKPLIGNVNPGDKDDNIEKSSP